MTPETLRNLIEQHLDGSISEVDRSALAARLTENAEAFFSGKALRVVS